MENKLINNENNNHHNCCSGTNHTQSDTAQNSCNCHRNQNTGNNDSSTNPVKKTPDVIIVEDNRERRDGPLKCQGCDTRYLRFFLISIGFVRKSGWFF